MNVFTIQDKVIEHILHSSRQQQAVEAAPKIVDPIQQTVSTLLRSYSNSPQLPRKDVKAALQILSSPLPRVHIRAVRKAHDEFAKDKDPVKLVQAILMLKESVAGSGQPESSIAPPVRREDLHLICFDYVCS